MKIALECFGGIRCGVKHNHIQHFIDTFPEIFNESNEVDIFLLTTKNDLCKSKNSDEEINEIKKLFGTKLKKIQIFEELDEKIKSEEEEYFKNWQSLNNKFTLSDDELKEYEEELIRGIKIRKEKNLYTPSLYEALRYVKRKIKTDKTVEFTTQSGSPFVRRLYYRRMLVNNMRKDYGKENNITYDWVFMVRFLDVQFKKLKVLDFINQKPEKDTIYGAVDHFIGGSPDLINDIYTKLGKNYPVVNYEQWNNERYKKEYEKFDIGILFLRHEAGWCSEHQLFWQILQTCKKFINLRAGCNFSEYVSDPNSYFISEFCNDRFK